MSIIRDLYEKYARCVVRITVRTTKGQLVTGAAFHLGGGYLATARHLLDKRIVERIDACGAGVADYPLGDGTSVRHVYFHPHPLSKDPVLVAAEAEVNAIIDKEVVPHPSFVLSAMPRGGFSGGPVISEYGFLLGVITEALYERRQIAETGFLAAITIEPLLAILADNQISLAGNENILYG